MSAGSDEQTAQTISVGDVSIEPWSSATPAGPMLRLAGGRYQLIELLGEGGMGAVWLANDCELDRQVAIKIVHPRLQRRPGGLQHFVEEAKIVAGLEHPGIVPVHDVGQLEDGRVYFAMRRVSGETLDKLWLSAPLARRVRWLSQVCQTVAYAHELSVVHRDLKPSNVMVGPFGQVMVMDWGLAKLASMSDDRAGVSGSVPYMAPEQALGQRVGLAADVYALGTMLFEFVFERRPWSTHSERLAALREGRTVELPAGAPDGLQELVLLALAPEPPKRLSMLEFGSRLDGWMEGRRQRDRALELVKTALEHKGSAQEAKLRAHRNVERGHAMLAELSPNASDSMRRPGWTELNEGRALNREVGILEANYLQVLQGALMVDPTCPEAHAELASHWKNQHERAERSGNLDLAATFLPFIRQHNRNGYLDAYLRGEGQAQVWVEDGVNATLERMVFEDQRLTPVVHAGQMQESGRVNNLPIGSYRFRLVSRDGRVAYLPVVVRRNELVSNQSPDGEPSVVTFPSADRASNAVLIPGGWFECGTEVKGGDRLPRRRLWTDSYLMQRHPTSNRQYLEFLNALAAQVNDVQSLLPRDSDGLCPYECRDGVFDVGVDAQGDSWALDAPVVGVVWSQAVAYANWRSAEDGLRWRLPFELEWARAARGADYRLYPWGGERCEVNWTRMLGSDGPPGPALNDRFPIDVSPHGVRHMAGQVQEWLADCYPTQVQTVGARVVVSDTMPESSGRRLQRGGSWKGGGPQCRVDRRSAAHENARSEAVGFRLAASWP